MSVSFAICHVHCCFMFRIAKMGTYDEERFVLTYFLSNFHGIDRGNFEVMDKDAKKYNPHLTIV